MRIVTIIAGILLGLIFLFASLAYFFKLVDVPPPPPGSPIASFMGALVPTHYMDLVKVVELLGGIFVAIPKTRRLGLLFLGPVIVNILAFHCLVAKGVGLGNPMVMLIVILPLILLYADRHIWAAFLRGHPAAA